MLDASVTLMNQYTAVTARLPPIPETNTTPTSSAYVAPPPASSVKATEPQPSTSAGPSSSGASTSAVSSETSATTPSTSTATTAASSSKASTSTGVVRIEDLGQEEHLDRNSSATPNENTQETSDSAVITDQSELRRKRLEKLLS